MKPSTDFCCDTVLSCRHILNPFKCKRNVQLQLCQVINIFIKTNFNPAIGCSRLIVAGQISCQMTCFINSWTIYAPAIRLLAVFVADQTSWFWYYYHYPRRLTFSCNKLTLLSVWCECKVAVLADYNVYVSWKENQSQIPCMHKHVKDWDSSLTLDVMFWDVPTCQM